MREIGVKLQGKQVLTVYFLAVRLQPSANGDIPTPPMPMPKTSKHPYARILSLPDRMMN
jgi:hypothetical protein